MPPVPNPPGDGSMRAPTIKDVAELAGVGFKTVSRVLNDEPNVRPETRERILAAVAELGYRRNSIASSIRRRDQRTSSIGLIVEDLANPFASSLTRAVQDYALERQHLVLVGSSDGVPERESDLVAEFSARRVDGLILVPNGTDQSYLEIERAHGIPVVFVDRPGRGIEADTVISENALGVAEAVRHLAAFGHTRIAFLGDLPTIHTTERRLAGFRTAMAELGTGPDPRHVRTGLRDGDRAYRAAVELFGLDPAPTALICGNNLITIGAVHALQHLGLRDRVAFIAFDDLELADLLRPALTVIAQDTAAIGTSAARALFERLQDPAAPYRRISLPVRLIPRSSGEIRASDPPEPRTGD
ncbi:LacI family DNA-binding transcriptional regulator [Glycomyces harbinensis]|uniref:LacI family transcriptional regulator n=1 Tax=Glycomyces harbinensis TaxID=58114 RepID=A0A1G7AD06_9ACTN|nr:LacI family DNA-binding transcriptional regulator [Glycomyces harbinensis]SDE12808.1 LacI family transcriptional regulator [Glycomyces harbinensis]